MKVSRIDIGRLGKAERTPQGGYRIPAYVTRAGVLEYIREDGSVQREYRPPEEVFGAASLDSLADAVVTDLHPCSAVNPLTYREVTVGHVSANPAPVQDGEFVSAMMIVLDAREIALIDAGERVENSCGYDCTLEMTPGVAPDGVAYDAVQKNISYNHVALLPKGFGRAGGDVSLRLDAKERPVFRLDSRGNSLPLGGSDMAHLPKTQRRDEDAPPAEETPATDAAVCPTCGAPVDAEGKYMAPTSEESAPPTEDRADAKDLRKQIATLQAKLDAALDTNASRVDAASVSKLARERASLERTAVKVGIDEARFDSLDDAALKREVIVKVFPKRNLDGREPAYLDAAYDSAREVLATGEYRPTVAADVKPPKHIQHADSMPSGDVISQTKEQLRKDGAL